jgi:hypothetical protein
MVDQGYDYTKTVDEAVDNGVSGVMCAKDVCPCPKIDSTLWNPSDQPALNRIGKDAQYDFTGKYDTLESCYEDKKMIWNSEGREYVADSTMKILKTLEVSMQC